VSEGICVAYNPGVSPSFRGSDQNVAGSPPRRRSRKGRVPTPHPRNRDPVFPADEKPDEALDLAIVVPSSIVRAGEGRFMAWPRR
jgi:hypothetical protein